MKKLTLSLASASIAATSIVAPTAAAASTDITVEKNDTLWDLANKHKTTVKDLKEINNLDSDNIQIGQQLKVAENKDTYVVKSGDSLWKIAQANHTSVEELKNINKLTSNTIFVNQKLEIPGIDYVMDTTAVVQKTSDVSTSAQTPVAEEVAPVAEKVAPVAEETAPVAEKAAPVAEETAPAAEETAPVAEETAPAAEEAAPVAEETDTNASTYEVKAGDSLSKIAALNELTNSETLSVGQVLAVKGEVKAPTVSKTPKETKPVAEEKTEATVNTNASTYKVNAGDTLAVIASQFETTTSKLVALNNLSNANSLTVGQTLKVKGSVPAPTVTAPKPTQTVATQTPSTQTVAKPAVSASTHTVKSGDSLGKIASQYGVSVSYLVNRNNLSNANDLSVGQVLQLKGAASSSVTPKPTTPKPTTPTTTYKPSKPSAPSTSGLSFNTLFSFAQQFSGTPYVWGGTTPSGFDCSGFTQYVYGNSGVSLNRTAGDQMNQSTKISEGQAKPGDLVFFSYNGGSSIDHVGIYMGNGQMINAQNNGVKIDNIHGNGWGEFLVGFGTVGNFN